MNRRAGVAVVAAGVAVVVLWWLHRGGDPAPLPRPAGDHRAGPRVVEAGRSVDSRTLPRGSISGTITDETKAPIARASVCARTDGFDVPTAITQRPICVVTDDKGQYKIANLVAADYAILAGAPQYLPDAFRPVPVTRKLAFALASGETRTGVDVVLHRGGVEITGVVRDIAGGPIAYAQVRALAESLRGRGPAFEADENGRFSLWVDRGGVSVEARADGYAASDAWGNAPGTFEIALTPESSIAGRVIDATTEQPVPGARVVLEVSQFDRPNRETDIADAQGAFRVDGLAPGRYAAIATSEHGYGRSEGSTLVGLGQRVDGVVVKLFPAHRVEGRIVVGAGQQPCIDGIVSLGERGRGRWVGGLAGADGSLVVRGVLPGTYQVQISCQGQSKRGDEPITVRDADVTGLVWRIDEGARIRGKVVTRSGEAVDGAEVVAQNVGGAARDSEHRTGARSLSGGRYELTGLKPGAYRIDVRSPRGVSPRDGYSVPVATGATAEQDLVLEDGGAVTGTVVDEDGAPVSAAVVDANCDARRFPMGNNEATTDARGVFTIAALQPGDYRVSARHDFTPRKPGVKSPFDPETVTVSAGEIATVKLVVESAKGSITGTVIDAAGAPVADAFVSSARDYGMGVNGTPTLERTRFMWDRGDLVLTAADGSFTLNRLRSGTHAVRAYRKGGGEAFAEHVAVGATVKLQIKPTGSIEGIVRGEPLPPELIVSIHDAQTGFRRSETLYRTGGHFKLDDLPAGHYKLGAIGDGVNRSITVDLAEGESKTCLDLALEPRPTVTVTGRLVDQDQKPIPRIRMYAYPDRADSDSSTISFGGDHRPEAITDESGKFTLKDIRPGRITLSGFSTTGPFKDFGSIRSEHTVAGSGTVDLGDVRAVPRPKRGQ